MEENNNFYIAKSNAVTKVPGLIFANQLKIYTEEQILYEKIKMLITKIKTKYCEI